jgi:hypothetical protein
VLFGLVENLPHQDKAIGTLWQGLVIVGAPPIAVAGFYNVMQSRFVETIEAAEKAGLLPIRRRTPATPSLDGAQSLVQVAQG